MQSLRKYIENQSELEEYTGSLSSFDNNELIYAEADIDKAIANFYEHAFRKSVFFTKVFDSAVLTTTTATISDISPNNSGYYDYCVLEILGGTNRGQKILIKSQSGTTLTFFETQTGLSETSPVKIYQEAKVPMLADVELISGTYYKTIPEFIKQAVAFQYLYRVSEGDDLNNELLRSEYEVNRDQYSERFDTQATKTIKQRLSPQALDLLDQHGLTNQTL